MQGEEVLKCVARKWGVIEFMWHAGRMEIIRKGGPALVWNGAGAGGERIKQTQKLKPITLYANLQQKVKQYNQFSNVETCKLLHICFTWNFHFLLKLSQCQKRNLKLEMKYLSTNQHKLIEIVWSSMKS